MYQKQHAAGAAKLDEAVDEADAGKRLVAASGHLDEGLGLFGGQAFFQIGDGADLRGPELVVHIEQVVSKTEAVVELELADGHADRRMDVGLAHMADVPARRHQQCIYGYPGFGLWCHTCSPCGPF